MAWKCWVFWHSRGGQGEEAGDDRSCLEDHLARLRLKPGPGRTWRRARRGFDGSTVGRWAHGLAPQRAPVATRCVPSLRRNRSRFDPRIAMGKLASLRLWSVVSRVPGPEQPALGDAFASGVQRCRDPFLATLFMRLSGRICGPGHLRITALRRDPAFRRSRRRPPAGRESVGRIRTLGSADAGSGSRLDSNLTRRRVCLTFTIPRFSRISIA